MAYDDDSDPTYSTGGYGDDSGIDASDSGNDAFTMTTNPAGAFDVPDASSDGSGGIMTPSWDFSGGGGYAGQGYGSGSPNTYKTHYGYTNPGAGRGGDWGGDGGYSGGFADTGGGGSFTGGGGFSGGGGGGGGYGSYIQQLQQMADLNEQYQNRSQGISQDFYSRGLQASTAHENAQVANQRAADIAANAVRRHGNSAMAAQDIAAEYNQLGQKLFRDLKARGLSDPGTIKLYTQRLQQEYLAAVRRLGPGSGSYGGGYGAPGGGGGGGYRIPSFAYGVMGGGTTDGSQGYYIPDMAWGPGG